MIHRKSLLGGNTRRWFSKNVGKGSKKDQEKVLIKEGLKQEIADYNRDIGRNFDVKYSPTNEARREVRVRHHMSMQPLKLSDYRNALYNYVFARSSNDGKGKFVILGRGSEDAP